MKIKVTQEHIDKGHRFCGRKCPISLAIKEATRQTWCVNLHIMYKGHFPTARDKKPPQEMPTPIEARMFANDFDLGNPVNPFEFDLPI